MTKASESSMSLIDQLSHFLAEPIRKTAYDDLDAREQVALEDVAKAALARMRRPTASMISAAQSVELPNGYQLTDLEVVLIWERMIDAEIVAQ